MNQTRHSLLRIFFVSLLALGVSIPLVYTLLHSFSSDASYTFWPDQWSLHGWFEVLIRRPHYLFKFWTSLLIGAAIVFGQAVISCLGGYGFSKFSFPGKEVIFFLLIVVMMMPYQVTLVSNYIVMDQFHFIDTFAALIVPAIFSPFGIFLMRQVFDTCPNEIMDAARMDGASELQVLFRILAPGCRTGLIALMILTFIDAWNMVEQPIIYLSDPYDYPLSVFLAQMGRQDIGTLCTCGVLAAIPALFLFFYCDEDLAKGISISQLH